ncbi:MAG TPA: hypothetical protein VER14_08165 [Phototrophicaceae bacterium]|nr:hypothetical protein [Phototrophicaceae bacterium]
MESTPYALVAHGVFDQASKMLNGLSGYSKVNHSQTIDISICVYDYVIGNSSICNGGLVVCVTCGSLWVDESQSRYLLV